MGPAAKVPRPGMDIKSPIDLGFVEDWDVMERIWEHGFRSINAASSAHPVLVAEPFFSTTQQREKLAELLFETFRVPAMYLGRQPVLSAFSMGRSTAVVVDIGASATRVTPVFDGHQLTKGLHMSEVGGGLLSEALLDCIIRGGYLQNYSSSSSPSSSSSSSGGAGAAASSGFPAPLPTRLFFKKVARKGNKPPPSSSSAAASNEVEMASSWSSSSTGGAAALLASQVYSPVETLIKTVGPNGQVISSSSSSSSSTVFDVYRRDWPNTTLFPGGAGPAAASATGAMAGLTQSFRNAAEVELVDDIKRSICTTHETGYNEGRVERIIVGVVVLSCYICAVAGSLLFSTLRCPFPTCFASCTFLSCSSMPAPDEATYELPDGQLIRAKGLRMTIPELLFNNDLLAETSSSSSMPSSAVVTSGTLKALLSARATSSWLLHFQAGVQMRSLDASGVVSANPVPLPKAVHGALLASVPEIRRELCGSVLLTGGGANLHNLHERLKWELMAIIPAAFKPKVVAPSPVEREFASWIGGSVLSSLGTFQQMWVSRLEYEEEGAAVLDRKCA